jgi:hypothetical protein
MESGSGDIAPRTRDLGTRWRWVVSFTPRPLCLQGKSPCIMRSFTTCTFHQTLGWSSQGGWDGRGSGRGSEGREKLIPAHAGNRTQNVRPVDQSLYVQNKVGIWAYNSKPDSRDNRRRTSLLCLKSWLQCNFRPISNIRLLLISVK